MIVEKFIVTVKDLIFNEDEKIIGSSIETHTIENVVSISHIVSIINSIISNNILFIDSYTNLDEVIVECPNKETRDAINNYYDAYPIEDVTIIAKIKGGN